MALYEVRISTEDVEDFDNPVVTLELYEDEELLYDASVYSSNSNGELNAVRCSRKENFRTFLALAKTFQEISFGPGRYN
ncbi:hypothetical protein [Pseudomonas sp. JDS28PS106]|uniref:hypothetical protein n=1 Tax=Pseudomonas sp. JDS28PS106 TaxID=2497235 RepID=UPI002FD56912